MQRFLRPDGVIRIRTRYGGLFSLRIDQYIEGVVIDEGYYESEVFEALRPWFTPGAVFWDIGANIGLHAVSAALLYPSVETHAFEPNSETFHRLQHHIDGNQVRVRAWPIALGDTDCAGTLHLATDENCGRCTVVPRSDTAGWPTLSIQISRADTLVANGELPAPTIIKLDVEGSEPAVLRGLGALLHTPSLRAVVFESSADLLLSPAECPTAWQLLGAGFELRALARQENTAHPLGNFLAFRP